MVIGYVTMHFTFVSLFLNMRTMGSKFWLGATVLISSTFSFLLALATVDYLGVPINMVLLSEGLPFLVVTVGFEKPFMLTKAVLMGKSSSLARPTKDMVNDAVRERGPRIVRDYAVEIAVLALGAASGVRGLRQFCFLAAWILGWDCVLLFTFYTAILSIKLEVTSPFCRIPLTCADQSYQETYGYSKDATGRRDFVSDSRDGCLGF
jgi:hydroxymethylglutaryl-CoA reductase (NADPH)